MTGWAEIDRYLTSLGVRIGKPTIGQTTGGTHTTTSWHYKGQARDYGQSNSDLAAILVALYPYALGVGAPIIELYGRDVFMKNGRAIAPSRALRDGHQNHVHVAIAPGRTLPVIVLAPEVPPLSDNLDLPNITGPLTLHLVTTDDGYLTAYLVFSPSTGEIHIWSGIDPAGKPYAGYYGRSEDPTPG